MNEDIRSDDLLAVRNFQESPGFQLGKAQKPAPEIWKKLERDQNFDRILKTLSADED